jgi:hypothetical protein
MSSRLLKRITVIEKEERSGKSVAHSFLSVGWRAKSQPCAGEIDKDARFREEWLDEAERQRKREFK